MKCILNNQPCHLFVAKMKFFMLPAFELTSKGYILLLILRHASKFIYMQTHAFAEFSVFDLALEKMRLKLVE